MHYARGALMESYIVADLSKQAFNQLRIPSLYFWRDHGGVEMDVMIETARGVIPIEVKAGMTIGSDYFKNFAALEPVLGDVAYNSIIVYVGESKKTYRGVRMVNWREVGRLYDELAA